MASSFPIPVRALVFSVAATLGSGFANGPALAGASGPFLAHQALYELKLVKARGTNAISGGNSYWMLQDFTSARAWLETADLSAETKSKLLRSREVQF